MRIEDRLHPVERWLDRLEDPDRDVVFVVGSALTMGFGGRPGVPGPGEMVELVRAHLRSRRGGAAKVAGLDQKLREAGDARAYQTAFDYLRVARGPDACNAVVREAILRAHRAPPAQATTAALAALEVDPTGWHLPRGVRALGHILARGHARYRGPVLTTNFDPLIEVAIRAAGGQANTIHHLGDGALRLTGGPVIDVVHLHGHWLDDTWHTPGALTLDRAALKRSLGRLFDRCLLVVMAYGGWEDALMASLAEVAADVDARPDVAWCFFDQDGAVIERSYPEPLLVLGRLAERAVCYRGVDCHAHLPALRARLDGEGEVIGRRALCDRLIQALDKGHAVEIIGEPGMGRGRLLGWLEAQARLLGRRVARVDARRLPLTDRSPAALMGAIAEQQGPAEAEAMRRALTRQSAQPTDRDAADCLPLLDGWLILVDDADALAAPGNGFTAAFFDAFRARMQEPAHGIQWVSVAERPLEGAFRAQGWTSRFLNDSTRQWAGAANRAEARLALTARLGPEAGARALAVAGTLPMLVERLCAAEEGDVEAAIAGLAAWAAPLFERWLRRSAAEVAMLRAAVDGVEEAALSDAARRVAVELTHRGLLVETAGGFDLNGEAWRAHVRGGE